MPPKTKLRGGMIDWKSPCSCVCLSVHHSFCLRDDIFWTGELFATQNCVWWCSSIMSQRVMQDIWVLSSTDNMITFEQSVLLFEGEGHDEDLIPWKNLCISYFVDHRTFCHQIRYVGTSLPIPGGGMLCKRLGLRFWKCQGRREDTLNHNIMFVGLASDKLVNLLWFTLCILVWCVSTRQSAKKVGVYCTPQRVSWCTRQQQPFCYHISYHVIYISYIKNGHIRYPLLWRNAERKKRIYHTIYRW